jgi:UDP-glucose 4-epimerase
MNKTILVTGGAGYIGSHTVVELLEQGYEVIVVDNYSNSKPQSLERVKKITGKGFKFYEIDLLNQEKLEVVFMENKIDAVIHFAGLKAVGESVVKPIKYYHNNITGSLVLFKLMEKYKVLKMVFSSSATVYGMNHPSPLGEELPLSTTNPYGTTKMMIEQILKDIYVSNTNWGMTLLRYFNPIGAHESGLIGEDPNGIPNNLMPYVSQVAIGKLGELQVYGSDYETHDGTGVRDYVHVVDLAKGHIKALEKMIDKNEIKVYNLGTGVGYSVLDLVNSFMKVNNVNIQYKIVDRRPGDVGICYANVNRVNNELGWKTEKTLDDMCRDAWRWQKNNPCGYE